MKETIAKINKTKSWFFKINKIGKSLARLIKRKRKTQINKIKNEKEVTIDNAEIERVIRDYYEQLYGNNRQILRKVQPSKTEPWRKRNHKQTNHKHWNWNCDQKSSNKQKPRVKWFHSPILSNI